VHGSAPAAVRGGALQRLSTGAPGLPSWARALLLALAYLAAARLTELLPAQPGYATPFWPSAGLALGGALLWGRRALAGVLLGAFVANLWRSYDVAGADLFRSLPHSALAPLLVAIGAALQAQAGAWLLRRTGAWPTLLDEGRHVFFYVVGCLAGCLVNATLGPLSLLATGVIPAREVLSNAFTWWVGDAIGVLVVMPLLLALFATPRETWRRRLVPIGAPLLGATLASVLVFVRASTWEQERVGGELERSAAEISSALSSNLRQPFEAVHALGAYWASSAVVTRAGFKQFTASFLERNPGLQALSWSPRVKGPERDSVEASARAEGLSRFAFFELDAAGAHQPAAARAEYSPVLFLEPVAGNEVALGFDLLANPQRREALDRATAEGRLVATARLSLLQETGTQAGVLVALPVYRPENPAPSERAAALRGHAVGVFRLGRLVEHALRDFPREGLRITLRDLDGPVAERLLYDSGGPAKGEGPEAARAAAGQARRWLRTLEVAGRRWGLEVTPGPAWLAVRHTWQAWAVLAFALLLVGTLGAFLLVLTGRTSRVEQLVSQRTAELAATVEGLRTARSEVQHSLEEKEVLIKEIHHRVKNNLQLVMSLLSLQSRYVRDPRAREQLEDSQSRVRSIGLVHEQLYKARDLAHVEFDDYVRELVQALVRVGSQGGVELALHLEPCALAVDEAIPCGLLLSELVTNALKHAFPQGRGGTLTVGLRRLGEGRLELSVEDDGVGLPPEDDSAAGRKPSDSLGMELVQTLTEQLDGTLEIRRTPHTAFVIRFPGSA
jgi:two-component sensor histidine kinase/integral membrane sensor domain MASE1